MVVCFHPASGDTHLLTDSAAGILRALALKPLSDADLREHLGGDDPAPILQDLESFSLVEAV
jgi:PqqD family protein of HPr-rel-A system